MLVCPAPAPRFILHPSLFCRSLGVGEWTPTTASLGQPCHLPFSYVQPKGDPRISENRMRLCLATVLRVATFTYTTIPICLPQPLCNPCSHLVPPGSHRVRLILSGKLCTISLTEMSTAHLPVQEHVVHRCYLDCLSHHSKKSFSLRDTHYRLRVNQPPTPTPRLQLSNYSSQQ